jgi:hypothetical protein
VPLYKLSNNAILEIFDDGGLVLIISNFRLLELNQSAVDILQLLDGQRLPEQVAAEIAKNHELSHNNSMTIIFHDVLELCEELNQSGVIELQPDFQENVDMTAAVATNILRNPVVVLREEDPDEGALLFNPDTNQVKVINTTGLFIWQQCGVARTFEEIVAEVKKGFNDVPLEQVTEDVQEFVDGMLATGFMGTIEN